MNDTKDSINGVLFQVYIYKHIIKCAHDVNIMVIRALVHEIEGAACQYRRCGRPSGFFDVQSELSSLHGEEGIIDAPTFHPLLPV